MESVISPKKTMGQISSELLKKTPDTLSPIDIQNASEKEYIDNLVWCVDHAQKKVDCSKIENHEKCVDRPAMDGSFFIVSVIKKEKLLPNVIRNYFIPTINCPTPTYDQTVYRYDHEKNNIEFIWVVPDRETCLTFKENVSNIVPAERGLLQFVLDFYDGTLYKRMKKFNKEAMHRGVLLEGK